MSKEDAANGGGDNNSLNGHPNLFMNEDGTNNLDGGVDLDDLFQDYYFGQDEQGANQPGGIPPVGIPLSQPFNPPAGTAMPQGPPDMMEYHGMKSQPATAKDLRKRKSNPSTYASETGSSKRGSGVGDKPLTDAQKVERRERNREHAKRSRLRKKFLLESLQEQINGLQSENESLKDIIRKECPAKAEELLAKNTQEGGRASSNYTPLPMPSGFGPVKTLMEPDFRLMHALSGSQQNFAISDPSLPDNPIVYVSQGFLDLTGYKLDQVLGRNCRFLQGPGTDQSAVDVIRKGLREGIDTSVCLLNYKADGTPFWNQFFVAALRDAEGNVVNFVGVQCEVSKATVESQLTNR
mmetsp:Transcript_7146/g.14447  ORF Transcript_7146/g.14447 Transcript_7146/m.14447 type:complete len:351 (-) Transcript_7146:101-1153(-)|eukprot:CAMPEP_0118648490 /NCGR_PEP_ID=MMETSP0785-20121206/9185_1 /TAXON_ID=91992 /ORGANISM="Bolidomonas pacifica, Strain CCMP 1866" /LENGTH=350 /DNA_ID=CAMNT_0006540689 /DNA_START=193 /DNA_END=1245 /DNA_ORIENTATION=+